jgi:hypothetical protein
MDVFIVALCEKFDNSWDLHCAIELNRAGSELLFCENLKPDILLFHRFTSYVPDLFNFIRYIQTVLLTVQVTSEHVNRIR